MSTTPPSSGCGSPSMRDSVASDSKASLSKTKKADMERQLREAFRERQRQNKLKQVEQIVLGKGLGADAETTLVEGMYTPQSVLKPLTEAEKELWEVIDLRKVPLTSDAADFDMGTGNHSVCEEAAAGDVDGAETAAEPVVATPVTDLPADSASVAESDAEPAAAAPSTESAEQHFDESEQKFLDKFHCSYRSVQAILEARSEVASNLEIAEQECDDACSPFLFDDVLLSLTTSLDVLEDGNASMRVTLPTYRGVEDSQTQPSDGTNVSPPVLIGADSVLEYVRDELLTLAYTLVPVTHTVQWVVQYTVAFLRSLSATSKDEAQVRLELLARCVRLVGKTDKFSSVLLLLEAKVEEYASFNVLKESAEGHVGALLDDVDNTINSILALPFPSRRARLRLLEKGIKKKLQRALLFLNEIDYNWTPNVKLHAEWKARFLTLSFDRIYCETAPRFAKCLFGFIDDALYALVSDSRVSGKLHGAAPVQPQVPLVKQVEYERTIEGLSLQQVGMQVKGNASILIGAQLCMGARYVLRQSTKEFNEQWGFYMDEEVEVPTQKDVEKFMNKITAKAKKKVNASRNGIGRPPPRPTSTVFLTQPDDEV